MNVDGAICCRLSTSSTRRPAMRAIQNNRWRTSFVTSLQRFRLRHNQSSPLPSRTPSNGFAIWILLPPPAANGQSGFYSKRNGGEHDAAEIDRQRDGHRAGRRAAVGGRDGLDRKS